MMSLVLCTRCIGSWDQDLMNLAIRKDCNCNLKNKRFHLREKCRFIPSIMVKKCKHFSASIFFAKMTS